MSDLTERNYRVELSHLTRYLLASGYLKGTEDVLDVFCGTGYGSEILSYRAKSVTAFDKFAASPKGFKFIQGEYPDIKIDGTFDMITCFEAIEHVPEDMALRLLSSMRAWLKDGGTLLISSPNLNHFPFDPIQNAYHYLHYTPEGLAKILTTSGFTIKEWMHQKRKGIIQIDKGPEGRYMIALCQ